jgi:hypothetical protein
LAVHTHDISGSTGSESSHTHDYGSLAADSGGAHTHGPGTLNTDSDSHSHDVDSGVTGSALSASTDIRPVYYALAYIMRIA